MTQSLKALNGFAESMTSDSGKPPENRITPSASTATVAATQTARRRQSEAGACVTSVRSATCCTSRSGTATCSGLHHGGEHGCAVDDTHLRAVVDHAEGPLLLDDQRQQRLEDRIGRHVAGEISLAVGRAHDGTGGQHMRTWGDACEGRG